MPVAGTGEHLIDKTEKLQIIQSAVMPGLTDGLIVVFGIDPRTGQHTSGVVALQDVDNIPKKLVKSFTHAFIIINKS